MFTRLLPHWSSFPEEQRLLIRLYTTHQDTSMKSAISRGWIRCMCVCGGVCRVCVCVWLFARGNMTPQVTFFNVHPGSTPPQLLSLRWGPESLECLRSVGHNFLCVSGELVFSTTTLRLATSLELSRHYFLSSSAFRGKRSSFCIEFRSFFALSA